MNRCIGYTKTNKKCRNLLKNAKYKHFCCNDHLPYNIDILEDGCFLCMENNLKREDLKMLRCKHLIHKPCYEEWKKHSTYDEDICIICRQEVVKKNNNNNGEEKGYIINSKKVKILTNKEDYNFVFQFIDDKYNEYLKNEKLNKGNLEFIEKNEEFKI